MVINEKTVAAVAASVLENPVERLSDYAAWRILSGMDDPSDTSGYMSFELLALGEKLARDRLTAEQIALELASNLAGDPSAPEGLANLEDAA